MSESWNHFLQSVSSPPKQHGVRSRASFSLLTHVFPAGRLRGVGAHAQVHGILRRRQEVRDPPRLLPRPLEASGISHPPGFSSVLPADTTDQTDDGSPVPRHDRRHRHELRSREKQVKTCSGCRSVSTTSQKIRFSSFFKLFMLFSSCLASFFWTPFRQLREKAHVIVTSSLCAQEPGAMATASRKMTVENDEGSGGDSSPAGEQPLGD